MCVDESYVPVMQNVLLLCETQRNHVLYPLQTQEIIPVHSNPTPTLLFANPSKLREITSGSSQVVQLLFDFSRQQQAVGEKSKSN